MKKDKKHQKNKLPPRVSISAQNAHITEELARRGEGAEVEKHIKNHARNTPNTLPKTIKIIEERIKHNETKHKTNMNHDQCRFAENTHIPEELSMGRKKMDPDHLTPPTNSAKKDEQLIKK